VGDVPDASFATNTGIISVAQVPSPQARNAANRRLREWAAMHPNVIAVPLEHFMSTAMANKELSIHGHTIPTGKSHAILQNDELHPNPRGTAILALGVLDTLVSGNHTISTNDIRWDAAEVFRIGYESAKPASPIQKQQ
jgi:lysophospholipase L1-like esterase